MKNLLKFASLLSLFLLSTLLVNAQDNCDNPDCSTEGIDLSTGVDHANSNNPIAVGQQDPYWEIINSPMGNTGQPWVINNEPQQAQPFSSAIGSGQWLSVSTTGLVDGLNPSPEEPYTFSRCFCVCDGEAMLENISVYGTDQVADIRINGNSVHNSTYQIGAANDYQNGIAIPDQMVSPVDGQVCIEIDIRKRVFNELPLGMMFFGQVSGEQLLRPDCCGGDDCQTTSLNFSTGVDHTTGNLYTAATPATTQDPYWQLLTTPATPAVNPGPAWVIPAFRDRHGNLAWDESTTANWISGFPIAGQFGSGTYTYERCFCLSEADSAKLDFRVFADDQVEAIRIHPDNNAPSIPLSFTPAWSQNSTLHFRQGVTITNKNHLLPRGRHCIQIDARDVSSIASGIKVEGNINGAFLEESRCCSPTASISGFKFNDLNANGTRDTGEPTLQGWQINLNNGQQTTTDQSGYYSFNNLVPGTYILTETQQAGWTQTFPAGNQPHTVVISGIQAALRDFGNTIMEANSSITGKKFHDLNCDGIRQADEPFLAGWTFDLYSDNDRLTPIQTVLSDPNGCFEFNGLALGNYTVQERVKAGWSVSTPIGGRQSFNIDDLSAFYVEFGNCLVNDPDACCDEEIDDTVIFHEDFEQGSNLANDYTPGSVTTPGNYAYMNASQASLISGGGWDVVGYSQGGNNCDPVDQFMVVNGRTRQSGAAQVYLSPILNAEAHKKYSVCVRLKHLPQCVFDVVPNVKVEIVDMPYVAGATTRFTSPWTSVVTNTTNCDYLTISGTFTALGPGLNRRGHAVNILLDETGLGDGNDLAIDEIIVREIPPVPAASRAFGANSDYQNTHHTVEVTPTPLGPDCTERWEVYEISDRNDLNSLVPGTRMVGNSNTSPAWGPGDHDFPGYNSTAPSPGVFALDRNFVIKRYVDCDCQQEDFSFYLFSFGPEGETTSLQGTSATEFETFTTAPLLNLKQLAENSPISIFTVYPNPFQSSFTMNFSEVPEKEGSAQIFSLTGQLVKQLQIPAGKRSMQVDLSEVPKGTYVINAIIGKEVYQQKIIKQ